MSTAVPEAMHEANALDFDDLLSEPSTSSSARRCASATARRFRYVLVDEYQDTNRAQYRLAAAAGGEHRNLCVVGDDDQSIYGCRGADIRNILEFERDFPDAAW